MPFATVNGARLYYRLEGRQSNPVLVLSHSIGTDHGMWAQQVPDLLPHFQVLRFDTRGHGASDAPAGEYTIEALAGDVLALTDSLKISKFAFCGLSLGGAIGQWLAINAYEHLSGVVLANTSPQFTPRSNWETRIKMVREGGMAAIADIALQRFFGAASISRNLPCIGSIKSVLLGTNPAGYLGCCAALRDFDSTRQLARIQIPALVIAGDDDVSTPWQGHGEILARQIPGAQAVQLPAAHLSNLERPRSFNAAIFGFLLPKDEGGAPERGNRIRRAVLGDAHVNDAEASITDFNRDFQHFIAGNVWGNVWARAGLDLRTRRLVALVILASLGRWEEFSMHVRAGNERELEACDLKEALLQVAVYAGVPAANTAFRLAGDILSGKSGKES